MWRQFADFVTRCMSWLKRSQKVRAGNLVVKVNLGSSLQVAPDWYNVDGSLSALASKWPDFLLRLIYNISTVKQWYTWPQYRAILRSNTFVFHNLSYGIPFYDEAIDYVFSSHLLEHLFKDEAEQLLAEALRVLKRGGRVRVCVPDLEKAVEFYHAGNKERALGYFFATSKIGDLGRHRYMYDFDLLAAMLSRVGFCAIERCAYCIGQSPDIDVLDNRADETLYVEAIKSSTSTL
jgi:SAM-dependent methyltransferase